MISSRENCGYASHSLSVTIHANTHSFIQHTTNVPFHLWQLGTVRKTKRRKIWRLFDQGWSGASGPLEGDWARTWYLFSSLARSRLLWNNHALNSMKGFRPKLLLCTIPSCTWYHRDGSGGKRRLSHSRQWTAKHYHCDRLSLMIHFQN